MPAGEAPPDLRLSPAGLVRLAFGRVLRREPVGPAAPDVHEPGPLTDAPSLGQAPGVDGHRGDAPPCRVARVAGPDVDDRAPDDRVQAVGTDEHVPALLGAVGASGRHPVGVLLDGSDLHAEPHIARRLGEHGLEVGSVDGDRSFEHVGRHLGQRAAFRGEDGAALRRCALRSDRFSKPEAVKRTHRVCEQADARPGWVDARRALEHDHVVSGAA
jgi:hypothetical protein